MSWWARKCERKPATEELKFCKDCRHAIDFGPNTGGLRCARPIISLVTGEKRLRLHNTNYSEADAFCSWQRQANYVGDRCGTEARFFEAKRSCSERI